MAIFRYILFGTSALAALGLLFFWTISGRVFDIVLFAALAFLITNAFYVFISRPIVKTSDILARASDGLALASMELKYQSEEAQIREAEAERIRLKEAAYNQSKLQDAKEMLQHLRSKPSQGRKDEGNIAQITRQVRSEIAALPSPSPVREDLQGSNNRDPAPKAPSPAISVGPAPPSAVVTPPSAVIN